MTVHIPEEELENLAKQMKGKRIVDKSGKMVGRIIDAKVTNGRIGVQMQNCDYDCKNCPSKSVCVGSPFRGQ